MKRSILLFVLVVLPGCVSHAVRVDPITVAPMQVTMDVNLHVDDERAAAPEPTAAAPEGAAAAEGVSATPAAAGTAAAAH